MDNLEKYITENRQEFDNEIPGLNVWSEIQGHLDVKPVRRIIWAKTWRIAAAIALLITAGGVIGAYIASAGSGPGSLANISPEHAEMERYFTRQVNEKMAQLASYNQEGTVKADIDDISAIYDELQIELKNSSAGNEEKIIQAMINTYQTKIEILEQVLGKIQNNNPTNIKTEQNEISI